MANILCSKCNKTISDGISNCPYCGNKIKHPQEKYGNMVAKGLGVVLIIFGVVIFTQNKSETNSKSINKSGNPTNHQDKVEKKWYEGGTLHKATMSEWRDASDENKIATCGDFVAKIRLDSGVAYNESEILTESYALKRCIDATQNEKNMSSWKVFEVAAVCLVELGYK